jgi:hypothetical protein
LDKRVGKIRVGQTSLYLYPVAMLRLDCSRSMSKHVKHHRPTCVESPKLSRGRQGYVLHKTRKSVLSDWSSEIPTFDTSGAYRGLRGPISFYGSNMTADGQCRHTWLGLQVCSVQPRFGEPAMPHGIYGPRLHEALQVPRPYQSLSRFQRLKIAQFSRQSPYPLID